MIDCPVEAERHWAQARTLPLMVAVEWGSGPQVARIDERQLDGLLDQVEAEAIRDGRPQDVQVTVEGAGTLGIVVGANWSLLHHIPPGLDPPYLISVGANATDDVVTFYTAGDHHTELRRKHAIEPSAARAALHHFAISGELSPNVKWEEV